MIGKWAGDLSSRQINASIPTSVMLDEDDMNVIVAQNHDLKQVHTHLQHEIKDLQNKLNSQLSEQNSLQMGFPMD